MSTAEHWSALARCAEGDDEGAKHAYVEVLREDPTNFHALNELGHAALAGGFRSAARTAYSKPCSTIPGTRRARQSRECSSRGRRPSGRAASLRGCTRCRPDLPEAHQGMASVLSELDLDGAEVHRQRGFSARSLVTQPYRGTGTAVPLLLFVSARGGNIPTQAVDRRSALHPPRALPRILRPGCAPAAARAGRERRGRCGPMRARARTRRGVPRTQHRAGDQCSCARTGDRTRRERRRLAAIPGVVSPRIDVLPRRRSRRPRSGVSASCCEARAFTPAAFRLCRDRPGVSGGAAAAGGRRIARDPVSRCPRPRRNGTQVPRYVHRRRRLSSASGHLIRLEGSLLQRRHGGQRDLPRGRTLIPERHAGRARCARDGGARANLLAMGLEYAGVDFALAPDGSVLLFEANATMVVSSPGPDAMWDYRRSAISEVLDAARRMLLKRAKLSECAPL